MTPGGGERVNDKQLFTDFASALEQAAALARKIAEKSDLKIELKLDEETFGRVVYRASHDNPEASASSPVDS